MSLINDALKRANQNSAAAPAPSSAPPSMVVAGSAPVRRGGSSWAMPALVVGMIGCSAFFFWKWRQSSQAAPIPAAAMAPAETSAQVVAPSAAPHVPGVPTQPAPAPTVTAATPLPPAAPAPAAVSPIPPTAPAAPVLETALPDTTPIRLQAILYRLRNPTAILNGRTLEIGQSVAGARLVDIQRSHVVIERHGQRQTLELP